MKNSFVINAPAKINLHLGIGARRQDGFHSIESIFLALSLCDTLEIEVDFENCSGETRITLNSEELPCQFAKELNEIKPEANLAFKAAEHFRKKTGFNAALDITLIKRIPAGAGLGGGSSDAASVLKVLGSFFPELALHPMAAALGSDTPFFLDTGAAKVSGRGEILNRIYFEPLKLVVLKPEFSSATARAYALFDSSGICPVKPAPVPLRSLKNPFPYTNDFLRVFLEYGEPEERRVYAKALAALYNTGAQFASVSGSGSACFGVFKEHEQALRAAALLKTEWPFVVNCDSI